MHRQRTGLIPCYAGTGPRPYSLVTYKWFGQSRNLMLSNTKCTDGACPHPRVSRSEPCNKDVTFEIHMQLTGTCKSFSVLVPEFISFPR